MLLGGHRAVRRCGKLRNRTHVGKSLAVHGSRSMARLRTKKELEDFLGKLCHAHQEHVDPAVVVVFEGQDELLILPVRPVQMWGAVHVN